MQPEGGAILELTVAGAPLHGGRALRRQAGAGLVLQLLAVAGIGQRHAVRVGGVAEDLDDHGLHRAAGVGRQPAAVAQVTAVASGLVVVRPCVVGVGGLLGRGQDVARLGVLSRDEVGVEQPPTAQEVTDVLALDVEGHLLEVQIGVQLEERDRGRAARRAGDVGPHAVDTRFVHAGVRVVRGEAAAGADAVAERVGVVVGAGPGRGQRALVDEHAELELQQIAGLDVAPVSIVACRHPGPARGVSRLHADVGVKHVAVAVDLPVAQVGRRIDGGAHFGQVGERHRLATGGDGVVDQEHEAAVLEVLRVEDREVFLHLVATPHAAGAARVQDALRVGPRDRRRLGR